MKTSTATRSCRHPGRGTAVIHFWLSCCVRRRPQRVTSAGSGGRRDTLRPPPPLLLRPGAADTAAAAVYSQLIIILSNLGLNLKIRHGAIFMDVTYAYAKLGDDRLWNEKALAGRKPDLTTPTTRTTLVAIGGKFPGPNSSVYRTVEGRLSHTSKKSTDRSGRINR